MDKKKTENYNNSRVKKKEEAKKLGNFQCPNFVLYRGNQTEKREKERPAEIVKEFLRWKTVLGGRTVMIRHRDTVLILKP